MHTDTHVTISVNPVNVFDKHVHNHEKCPASVTRHARQMSCMDTAVDRAGQDI